MLFLVFIITKQRRNKRNTVKTITFKIFIYVFFRKFLISYKLTESRHNIIKSKLMIIHGTSFHFPWPTHDKRDSYATFITLALQATQFSVTTKKFRISSSLFMRTIITTKYYYCVFIQTFFFQFRKYFTDVCIQTGYHTGKFCMCMYCRIVSATLRSPPSLIMEKLLFILFQNRIIRLNKFCMRKRISKKSIERPTTILGIYPFQCFLMN